MKKKKVSTTPRSATRSRRIVRFTRRLVGTIVTLSIVAILSWGKPPVGFSTAQLDETQNTPSGWGAEVLYTESVPILDHLIRPANACGLGASSCFKCHNGKRAAIPGKRLWHSQHAAVNNSCVGCHGGNPRLIRKDMSHKGLIADPRSQPDASCKGCHQGNNIATLVQTYTKIAN